MKFDTKSVLKGIRVMRFRNDAKWAIRLLPRKFWLEAWTPAWHERRGPYLSCGIWLFAIYRGY